MQKKIEIYDACIHIVPFQSSINFERGQNSQAQSLNLNMINQSFNCYLIFLNMSCRTKYKNTFKARNKRTVQIWDASFDLSI